MTEELPQDDEYEMRLMHEKAIDAAFEAYRPLTVLLGRTWLGGWIYISFWCEALRHDTEDAIR